MATKLRNVARESLRDQVSAEEWDVRMIDKMDPGYKNESVSATASQMVRLR